MKPPAKKPKRKPGPGRKRIEIDPDAIPDFAASIPAAAKIWGIPEPEINRAKREGCQAFRGSRIYQEPLMAWLKANPPHLTADGDTMSKEALNNRKLLATVLSLEHKLAIQKGNVIDAAVARDEWARYVGIFCEEALAMMPDSEHYAVMISRIRHRLPGMEFPDLEDAVGKVLSDNAKRIAGATMDRCTGKFSVIDLTESKP